MVTKAQIDKLEARIEQMAVANNPAISVAVFKGETPEFAMQRHCELRPEHKGRRMQLKARPEPRHHVAELLAAHSQAEITATIHAIWAQNERVPLGNQYVESATNKMNERVLKC